jgi:hypothetical protein
MLSATDGWASGQSEPSSDAPLIVHYNGHEWVTQATPAVAQASTSWPEMFSTASVQPEPDGEVWALTTWQLPVPTTLVPVGPPPPNLSGTAILHYDGHQWQVQMSAPGVLLSSLSMDSGQDGWAMGITEPSHTNQASSSTSSISGTSAQALLYHYTQGHWERSLVKLPISSGSNFAPVIGKLAMVSPSDGWMLGATYSYPPWVRRSTLPRDTGCLRRSQGSLLPTDGNSRESISSKMVVDGSSAWQARRLRLRERHPS